MIFCRLLYQVDGETIMLLYIKLPKNIFGFGISQYDKDSTYTMSFNISDFFGSYLLPSHLEHG